MPVESGQAGADGLQGPLASVLSQPLPPALVHRVRHAETCRRAKGGLMQSKGPLEETVTSGDAMEERAWPGVRPQRQTRTVGGCGRKDVLPSNQHCTGRLRRQ